jgi:hypothetical protein
MLKERVQLGLRENSSGRCKSAASVEIRYDRVTNRWRVRDTASEKLFAPSKPVHQILQSWKCATTLLPSRSGEKIIVAQRLHKLFRSGAHSLLDYPSHIRCATIAIVRAMVVAPIR